MKSEYILHAFFLILFYNYSLAKENIILPYQISKFQKTEINDSIVKYKKESFLKELTTNIAIQAKAPFHLTKKDTWHLLGGMIITTGLIGLDHTIDIAAKGIINKNNSLRITTDIFTELGGNYGIGFCAAFAGYSLIGNNSRGIETSRLVAQSLIISSIWSRLGKVITGRERPMHLYTHPGYDNDDLSKWSGPFHFNKSDWKSYQNSGFDAFPSGHTSTAFAIATVFAKQYEDYHAVPVIAYSLATIVGITRLMEHQHWSSDVFTGAILGYLCGKEVCCHYKNKLNNRNDVHCYLNYFDHKLVTSFSLRF
jgi:membrane-associated phospholipid phosphatase